MSSKGILSRLFGSGKIERGEGGSMKGNSDLAREMAFKAFHHTPNLMAISNLDNGIFLDVNESFLLSLGYEKSDIIGYTSEKVLVFPDIESSNKYFVLLSRFRKVTDYPVSLRMKNGELKHFLFSSETIRFGDELYLLTTYNEIVTLIEKKRKSPSETILNEIFETISSYLMLFTVSENQKFIIYDLNSKVEDVENITRTDVIGKAVEETPLSQRSKLLELLHHIRITGDPHKLYASPEGNDSQGYYMGFILSSGDIVVTWEPGQNERKSHKGESRRWIVYDKLADMLPELIYEIDLEGRVTYANTQALNFFGFTWDDIRKGFSMVDIFPPEELPKARKNLARINIKNQTVSNEYIAIRSDKTRINILTRTFGIFDGEKLTGYRGVVTDITEQKKHEEQIIKEKAFLEHLIDSTPQAIVITDIPGKITLINKEFTNLFGYTQDEAVNCYIDDLIVPEELKDEAEQIDQKAMVSRKEIIQTERVDKSGNRINVSLIASNIVINDVTVALLGIYRDITVERKSLLLQEILYNISTAALKQLDIKEIYPTIVKELSKIWDTNNFYIALYDNLNQTLSLPFFSDEKDDFNEIPAKGTITGWVINNKKSVLLKEDDIKKMEEEGIIDLVGTPCKVWMGVPLRVENDIIGIMCLQDYRTEDKFSPDDLNVLDFIANQIAIAIQRRTMLDNLIIARQKAEEAAQSKQLFMSTMSHEIRTPLNEVIGITNLLMQTDPKENQLELIKTLRFSTNHLMTLVNDVLDFNKMELGKIVFEQTQFNLIDFLEEIKRSYSYRANEKKLNFDIVWSDKVPAEIIGDQIRLNQILSNLLSNALKFTIKGGIEVFVDEISRSDNQSSLEFTVKDTGIGIKKEMHNQIFEIFTQASTDTTRRFGGTGLGLPICKKLVELQGGTLRVESEPDKGSSFIFNLVFGISKPSQKSSSQGEAENYRGLEGKRILVAEDNKINFFVANKFLISWGVKVDHAEDGQLALEKIEKEDYDLVLMDLHMPILDGIEATRIIRNSKNPRIKDIPIIALTAAIMSESHDRIEGLNINDYVLKPFKPQDLYQRLIKHIR